MSQPIRHRAKRTDSERFGRDVWVTGHYFRTPISDENSGAPPESGWFFLAGADQPVRHIIEGGGTAYTVDPDTLEPVVDDIRAAGYVPATEAGAREAALRNALEKVVAATHTKMDGSFATLAKTAERVVDAAREAKTALAQPPTEAAKRVEVLERVAEAAKAVVNSKRWVTVEDCASFDAKAGVGNVLASALQALERGGVE